MKNYKKPIMRVVKLQQKCPIICTSGDDPAPGPGGGAPAPRLNIDED